ncbi:Protein SFI1, partial [Lamprotornis superbus]
MLSKSLMMHEFQQPPEHQVHAAGQSVAPQSATHEFQDRGQDKPGQDEYTRSQRRMLKKCQSRYLARKFFYLWAKITFGQVLPSKARCFYDQKILKKTFGEWKEQWTVCREKLTLRADNHYRHLLLNLIFKAWRAYVYQQQGKRKKYYVAESHAKKQTLLRTWQHWLVYVDVQRTKHGMQSVALAFRERSCLCISWAVWRRQHYQKCCGHKMNILALQHWAQSLQFRAWLQWRELYLYIQDEKQKDTRAVTHHQHWELRRCVGAWLGYLNLHRSWHRSFTEARRSGGASVIGSCHGSAGGECMLTKGTWKNKQQGLPYGESLHTGSIVSNLCLVPGKDELEAFPQREDPVNKQECRAVAYFNSVTDVVLCVEEARQCELAEKHYKCHLLELGLKGLRQNVLDTHLQQMRTNLSSCQHRVTMLQRYWNRWKSRLEEKEEEQQQALTSVAHARYRRVLMRQVFDTWLLKVCKLQEYRMGEKKAVLHFQRQLLRCFWCCWRERAAARLEEQKGLVCAGDHYSNQLLLKAFCLWKQKTQERETERLKETEALRFHCSKCLQQTWNKWREYVEHQREKWRKLVQADLHYRHVLLGKTLAAWKIYQQNIQCILYQVAEKEKQHTRLLLRQVLCTWRENALALIHESKATSQADEHYRRAILSKVLLQWRDTAWLRACHRHLKVTAVVEARKHLEFVHLQSLFLHWKELMRESLVLRAQHHRAAQHHQQHLLQKYLVKWKNYHQQCLGKKLLQRRGDELMTHRLCSASFSCWKTRLLQQQWEKRKTVQALWHWSLSVQRKVFDAWLRFAKGQQEKKDGIEKVTGVHHTTPLREGVTHALRNTTGIEQLQGQLHTQHQLEKQVTFKKPDVSPETRGDSSEEEPWPSKCRHLPLHPAEGGSFLRDLSEVPFQLTSVNKCPAQTGNLMLTPHVEESTCKCLSQMGNAAHPHPSLTCAPLPLWTQDMHRTGQGPELWSPASFMSQMKAGSEEVSEMLKEQLGFKRNSGAVAEGEKREHSSREEMLERKVEAELRQIQQQMQYYYSRKQELKCCQQQAQILQQWLEMSTQPGAQDGVQRVQEELGQVRISTLTKAQLAERQHVQALLARLRDIQLALDLSKLANAKKFNKIGENMKDYRHRVGQKPPWATSLKAAVPNISMIIPFSFYIQQQVLLSDTNLSCTEKEEEKDLLEDFSALYSFITTAVDCTYSSIFHAGTHSSKMRMEPTFVAPTAVNEKKPCFQSPVRTTRSLWQNSSLIQRATPGLTDIREPEERGKCQAEQMKEKSVLKTKGSQKDVCGTGTNLGNAVGVTLSSLWASGSSDNPLVQVVAEKSYQLGLQRKQGKEEVKDIPPEVIYHSQSILMVSENTERAQQNKYKTDAELTLTKMHFLCGDASSAIPLGAEGSWQCWVKLPSLSLTTLCTQQTGRACGFSFLRKNSLRSSTAASFMFTPKVQMYRLYTGFRSHVGSSTWFRRPQARESSRNQMKINWKTTSQYWMTCSSDAATTEGVFHTQYCVVYAQMTQWTDDNIFLLIIPADNSSGVCGTCCQPGSSHGYDVTEGSWGIWTKGTEHSETSFAKELLPAPPGHSSQTGARPAHTYPAHRPPSHSGQGFKSTERQKVIENSQRPRTEFQSRPRHTAQLAQPSPQGQLGELQPERLHTQHQRVRHLSCRATSFRQLGEKLLSFLAEDRHQGPQFRPLQEERGTTKYCVCLGWKEAENLKGNFLANSFFSKLGSELKYQAD